MIKAPFGALVGNDESTRFGGNLGDRTVTLRATLIPWPRPPVKCERNYQCHSYYIPLSSCGVAVYHSVVAMPPTLRAVLGG